MRRLIEFTRRCITAVRYMRRLRYSPPSGLDAAR